MKFPRLNRNSKRTTRTGSTQRRGEVTRARTERERQTWRAWLGQPVFFALSAIAIAFIVLGSTIIVWSRAQPYVAEGQIMDRTRLARLNFEIVDEGTTNAKRDEAARSAPRVYFEVGDSIAALRQALLGLPRILAGKTSIAQVDESIVSTFKLDEQSLAAIQSYVDEQGEPTTQWVALVDRFINSAVKRRPIIDSGRWQQELTLNKAPIRLQYSDSTSALVTVDDLLDASGSWSENVRTNLLRDVPGQLRTAFEARLRSGNNPTFAFNEAASSESAREAAQSVEPQRIPFRTGDILARRGDQVTPDRVEWITAENRAFNASQALVGKWIDRVGIFGMVVLMTLALVWSRLRFSTSWYARPRHVLGVVLLGLASLAVSVAAATSMPQATLLAVLAPATLFAIIVHVGFGPMLAVSLSIMYAAMTGLAFPNQPAIWLLVVIGASVAVAALPEIRDRNTLVRAGAMTGIVIGLTATLISLLTTPNTFPMLYWRHALTDGLYSASAGLLVGLFALGVLSTIERAFDVTTGLTLVELRDPKHPLLQELHQRAPGTWNHSLQVANIAESAARAIGADSLLTYVGALYHDIGKMNKPQYFVENQSGGPNRHEKLSPTMSLLLIVGHVKDGMEMAREWGIPKPIHHFIEAHHGTTLVEYFYHVAKERAQAEKKGDEEISEVTYRYPGPRPRNREVAIIMLADAAESASRTLADFSPTRVEQLVRSLGEKRLLDNQFDDCNLTLRELRLIEDSIIKSICAIRHARVSYPAEKESDSSEAHTNGTPTKAVKPRPASA